MKTPITDAAKWINVYPEYHEGATRYVDSDLARRLELDRAALMEALELLLSGAHDYQTGIEEARIALAAARANFPTE